MNITRTDPHAERVPFPLLRPRPGQPLRFCSLSRKIFGLDTHWGNDATFHCIGSPDCHYCKQGKLARYQGYIMGRSLDNLTIAVIHLTASAAEFLSDIDRGDLGLCGIRIKLERKTVSENAEVIVSVLGYDTDVPEIPDKNLSELMHSIYRMRKSDSAREKLKV